MCEALVFKENIDLLQRFNFSSSGHCRTHNYKLGSGTSLKIGPTEQETLVVLGITKLLMNDQFLKSLSRYH